MRNILKLGAILAAAMLWASLAQAGTWPDNRNQLTTAATTDTGTVIGAAATTTTVGVAAAAPAGCGIKANGSGFARDAPLFA
jgi:hypothetical protein